VATENALGAQGLYLDGNPLTAPKGSFLQADNVAVRRPGVIESFPGRVNLGGTFGDASAAEKLTFYKETLIAARANDVLTRHDGSSTYTNYAGTYARPDTDARVHFAEAAQNLFFTTEVGPYRLDAVAGTPVLAGEPQALESKLALTGGSGFMPTNSQVAYRHLWATKDVYGRLIRGAPSGRTSIHNSTGGSRNVIFSGRIPTGITTSHFCQVYRSEVSPAATTEPSDEMQLVYEFIPTNVDITAGTFSFTEIASDSFRPGAALYTSPGQQGVLQSNLVPPFAKEIAEYRNSLLLGNVKYPHRLIVRLLSPTQDEIYIDNGTGFSAHRFLPSAATEDGSTYIASGLAGSSGSVALDIENDARSIVRAINLWGGVRAYYISSDGDIGATILLESLNLVDGPITFYVTPFDPANGSDWSPVPGALLLVTVGGLTRAANVVTASFTGSNHGMVAGQTFTLTPTGPVDPNFPAGTKTVATVPTALTVTYAEIGANGSSVNNYQAVTRPTATVISEQEVRVDMLAWSKQDEPDAFPIVNRAGMGKRDAKLLRILPLAFSTLIFKEDGTWRLTGDTPQTFRLEPFDPTLRLLAPETLVALEGQAYGLFNKGVLSVSEGGAVQPLSFGLIETALTPLRDTAETQLVGYSFGIANEAKHEYELHLPASAASTSATQAYVFNTQTSAWTRKELVKTCGLFKGGTSGRLYYGNTTNSVSAERITGTSADYQDELGVAITERVKWTPFSGGGPSIEKTFQGFALCFAGAAPTGLSMVLSTPRAAEVTVALDTSNATNPAVIPAQVPPDMAMGPYIRIGITHTSGQEKLELLGIVPSMKPFAEQGGK
jgi:hypothetical protein